jgi:putative DNA primase/helicase
MGYPVAVAFNAGNLEAVAKAMRRKLPDLPMIICADDDSATDGNPGLTKARQAALATGAKVAVPDFGDQRPEGATDFNDMVGLEAVAKAISAATEPVQEGNFRKITVVSIYDFLTKEFPPRENLLTPWLPMQGLALVFAARGIGKTFFALNVAYAVACGGEYLGWKTEKPHGVLFIDGEMPASVLQDRLARIAETNELEPVAPLKIITPDLQESGMVDLTDSEDQEALLPYLDGVDLIIADNLSTLCRTGKENEAESWLPIQGWALRQRAAERSVLFIHHAGKSGAQRGTSRREDILDTVINLRRPANYDPSQGCVFELHFEKNRGFHGDDAAPLMAQLMDMDGRQVWIKKSIDESTYEKVVKLSNDGLNPTEIADTLDIHKSNVSRHQKKARVNGDLH